MILAQVGMYDGICVEVLGSSSSSSSSSAWHTYQGYLTMEVGTLPFRRLGLAGA